MKTFRVYRLLFVKLDLSFFPAQLSTRYDILGVAIRHKCKPNFTLAVNKIAKTYVKEVKPARTEGYSSQCGTYG